MFHCAAVPPNFGHLPMALTSTSIAHLLLEDDTNSRVCLASRQIRVYGGHSSGTPLDVQCSVSSVEFGNGVGIEDMS